MAHRPVVALADALRRRGRAALTTGEFDLLSTFVRNPNRALSRDQLMALMHHREAAFDRAIDVQVGRLRARSNETAEPELIKSVRGVGYLFAARVSPDERAPGAA